METFSNALEGYSRMTIKPTTALPLLVLALTAGGCAATSEAPSSATVSSAPSADTVADPLVGEWTMTTLEVGTAGDLQEVPYGGQVIFTDAGTMAVQAANPDTTAPDTAYTVTGYEAFYGPVEVDAGAGTLEVEVESALARVLVGQTLSRNYEVTGDTLVLTPTDPAEGFRVTYERAGA